MTPAAPKAPMVSVIIPAYNTSRFIGECLDSVFSQNFKDFEVIVVNDGSPDTAELERAILQYRDRLIYVRQENRGLSGARNTGIRVARGDALAFLDSDDVWPPDYLSAQVQCFKDDPDLDLVYADATLFGTGLRRNTFMQTSAPPTTVEGLLSEGGQILPSGTVVKKRVIEAVGLFDEDLRRCEDYDMWLRLAQHGAKILFQPRVLFLRRVHEVALTSDEEKMTESLLRVLAKVDRTRISSRSQELLQDQIVKAQGELGLVRGKANLAAGNASAAREDLTAAYAFFHSKKIGLALLGLRVAPRFTVWSARMWFQAKERMHRERRQGTSAPL